jgi:drug/metabolite transporter (DMT)-like permease
VTGYRLAIHLAIAQQLLFTVDIAAIHQLSGSVSLMQVGFVRSVGGVALALCLAPMIGWKVFHTRHPWLQATRAGASAAYVIVMIVSLAWMPLADATAISYLTGLYVVLLAGPLLGETIGAHRCLAVVVGLAGAMMIANPGMSQVSWFYFAVMAGTVLNALGIVLTRYLRRDDSATTILLYVQLLQLAVFSPGAFEPFDFGLWPWMLAAAITGPLGMYCGIVALHYADASALAPYAYLRLALATGAAVIFFGESLGLDSIIGSCIIVAACVMVSREPRSRWATVARQAGRDAAASIHALWSSPRPYGQHGRSP